MASTKEELKKLILERAVERGEFILSSGERSHYYIDAKRVTLDPEGAYLIGEAFFDQLAKLEIDAVGGLTLGADPIATAIALISHKRGRPIPAFIVRKAMKAHGTMKRIEGALKPASRVAIVEDVVTKGGSALEAARAVEAEGHRVVKVLCLVDREQSGGESIRASGYDFGALFTATELGLKHDENSG
mgnify:CR=1 FL=1